MSYVENTVVSNAAPTTALVSAIEAQLTAHEAWSFVEQVTDGSFTVRIWRNLGTKNDWGADFYVALMVTTSSSGTSNLIMKAAESWDGSTKLATRGCPNPASTYTPDATFNSAYGTTGYAWSSTNWNANVSFSTSITSFTYRIVVTSNGLHVFTSTSNNYGYAGLFETWWPSTTNEFPLCVAAPSTSTSTRYTSVSRRPTETTSMSYGFYMYYVPSATYINGVVAGNVGASSPSALYGSSFLGARLVLQAPSGPQGTLRGHYRDVLVFAVDSVVNVGDTVMVDGKLYVCMYDTGSFGVFVDTSAA